MEFITKLTKHSPQLQRWGLILLIIVIFSQAYSRSQVDTWKSPPNLANYAQALSIAISELNYGSEQSIGYLKIYNLFTPFFGPGVDWGPEFSVVNSVIDQALQLENVASEGIHSSNYEGLSSYYKLALWLFGYRAESAFYLFWLLLAASILIFVITFYNRPILLFYLLLFVIAFSAITQTQGILIESIVRNRFFPILTILPSFYLALIIFGARKTNWITILGAFGQALMLALLFYIRPSSLYQLLFLLSISVILIVLWRKKSEALTSSVSSVKQLWPIAVVLICYGLIRINTLNSVFPNTLTNRSCTWHMVYMGLGGHPEALDRYGIFPSDGAVIELVARQSPKLGYNFNSDINYSLINVSSSNQRDIVVCDKTYEQIVKDEFLKILKEDPGFVISSYFHRITQYFEVYFNPLDQDTINWINRYPLVGEQNYSAFGVIEQLISWPVIIALILAIFLIEDTFLREWLLPLGLLVIGFLWAFSVPIFYYPSNNTIADSALYLTMIFLALFAATICYGLGFIQKSLIRQPLRGYLYIMGFTAVILLIAFDGYYGEIKAATPPKVFYGQLLDQRVEKYHDFEIILYQSKYYALNLDIWPVDLTNENALKECGARGQCVMGNSLAEVTQRVDQLQPPPAYEMTGLLKAVFSSSAHPSLGSPKFLFDAGQSTANTWHSVKWPIFPQWIDVVFRQPVRLTQIGLQAQAGGLENKNRAPHQVVVLGGENSDTAKHSASLQFKFEGDGAWSFQELPDTNNKAQWYRLLILDNHNQADFITIQEMRLQVSFETDYQGFDILWENGQYYALARLPWVMSGGYLKHCQEREACVVGDSVENVKAQVDKLHLPPQSRLNNLLKKIASSSTHPTLGSPEFLFDHMEGTEQAWHSTQHPEYPQWLELEFQQPVTLAILGFQAQIGQSNLERAPRDVVVLAGADAEMAEYKGQIQFEFNQAGAWSFQGLPQVGKKYQHYRILIQNSQKQANFVTMQEMRLRILVEKDYKGFDILWENGYYYVLAQQLGNFEALPSEPIDPAIYQMFCAENRQCGIANSLEEAKQLVEQLTP